MMAVAGREEKFLCVRGGECWDGYGVGETMVVGRSGEKMTVARTTLPLLAGIGGILLHLPTLQDVKAATFQGKGRCKEWQVGAGRGEGAGQSIGVGGAGATVGGVGTAGRQGGGGAGGGRGEGGVWSSGGRGEGPGAADTVQPRTSPPQNAESC